MIADRHPTVYVTVGNSGEILVILGVLLVVGAIGGMVTGLTAPVDLEVISWLGAAVALAGAAITVVGT